MTLQQERLEERPPNPLLAALDLLQKWERGELNDVSPDDLLYLRATQVIKLGLTSNAIAEATA